MTVFALLATLGTRSRAGRADVLEPGAATPLPTHFLVTSLQCLRNRSFRVLFTSSSLFFLAVAMNTTLSIHFLTYYARIDGSKALSASQGALYLAGFLGMIFWLRVSPRMEKQWLYVLGTLATGLVMASVYFVVGEGHLLGTNNVPALLIGHALVGFFSSTLWFIPAALLADVVDEDELATGERREGSFFGLFSFGQQLATGVSLVLTGLLVDRFAGLVPGQAVQSAETVRRIGLLYGVLPGALLLVAGLGALRYKLDRRQVAVIQRELDARRAAVD
jgi:Na+/melibiose symporter-like transporter